MSSRATRTRSGGGSSTPVNTAELIGEAEAASRAGLGLASVADPGFDVEYTVTVEVSGGGGALQTAIDAAAPGTRLLIVDSLDYTAITIGGKTSLVIEAATSQSPRIAATSGVGNKCINLTTGNVGVKISKLRLQGNGNHAGTGNQSNYGLINMYDGAGTIDKLIVEDCIFSELVPADGSPAFQIAGGDGSGRTNVVLRRCIAIDTGADSAVTAQGCATIEISGVTNVWVQSCTIFRTNAIARATSQMRGFGFKSANVLVENCLVYDAGTGGSDEAYKVHSESNFGTVLGVHTFRRCVALNCKRGFRINCAGATMKLEECLVLATTTGIMGYATARDAGTLTVKRTILRGGGDGTAFNTAVNSETYNKVENFSAVGITLDATDITAAIGLNDLLLFDRRVLALASTLF